MEKIETYKIQLDSHEAVITISGVVGRPTEYSVEIPALTQPTLALLSSVRNKLITELTVTTSELLDVKAVETLKTKFIKRANELIKQDFPHMEESVVKVLITRLMHDMVGLGDLEYLLADPSLEEIVINSPNEPVMVYHKKHGWLKTNLKVDSDRQIMNYSEIIARRVGKQVTTLEPLLDAHLITGDRANTVLYPIANKGNTLTIRKFARDPWTVTDFIKNKTCSTEIFAIIWMALQFEMNVLFSGGTATGKTSFLNTCLPFIPQNQRILTIEDTRELVPNKELYWTPLVTRLPNPEGKGGITMLDLLVNSLRMRPDRIILGEIRRKEEAEVLFEAMHTGHSVYATVHADTLVETVSRLTNPPISVPINLLQAVDLNIVMFRDRRTGIRRVCQIGEFIIGEEEYKPTIKTNMLFRWKPGEDKIVEHSKSLKLIENIATISGLTPQEVNKDLKERAGILDFLVKKNIRTVDEIGRIMKTYYMDKALLLKCIKKGNIKELLR